MSSSSLTPIPPAPLKVVGSRGLYLAPSTPFFRSRWEHLFPKRGTRIAASIALFVAIAISIAWTTVTVKDKWVYDINHPTTTLTTMTVDSVPAIPGLATLSHSNYWFNQTLENTIFQLNDLNKFGVVINPNTPLPTYITPRPIPEHNYNFAEVFLSGERILPDGSAGIANFPISFNCVPPASNQKGSILFMQFCIPDDWDLISNGTKPWPYWFNSTLDTMCMSHYSLLDPRSMVEADSFVRNISNRIDFNKFTFQDPYLYLSLMDLSLIQSLGNTNPYILSLSTIWSRPITFGYNHRHLVQTLTSKTIEVDGTENYHTTMEATSSMRYQPAVINEAFDQFYQAHPDIYQALLNDPNIQLNRSAPDFTQQHYMEICIGPTSLSIPVITKTNSYGYFAFISDLGGLLSILSIAFMLTFPLAQSLIIPRSFVGLRFWSLSKQVCWDEDTEAGDPTSGSGNVTAESSINGDHSMESQHEFELQARVPSLNGRHGSDEPIQSNGHAASSECPTPTASTTASATTSPNSRQRDSASISVNDGAGLQSAKVILLEEQHHL